MLSRTKCYDDTTADAPTKQSISRDDNADDDDNKIVVERLRETHFVQALEVENEFMGSTNKAMCYGLCPLKWCPSSLSDFEKIYRNHPDRCQTYGVAVQKKNGGQDKLLGVVCLRTKEQYANWDEQMIHECRKHELYIDHLAVTKDARGKGVGTMLLKWAEEIAKERNCNLLTLGVVKGNPAKRLYDRFGFEDVPNGSSHCCLAGCVVGAPHGQFGATDMEKKLESQ